MDLPPPTYALLLGPTLLAFPVLVRRAKDAHARRTLRLLLAGLSLVELGLALLYYGKLFCWPLACLGVLTLGVAAAPRAHPRQALAALPLAVGAGLLFQFNAGEAAFFRYFALGLPLSLAVPLVALAARWLRWDASWRTLVAGLGLVAFGGFVSLSAFALDFLRLFEVVHLPILLLTLAGAAWLLGKGGQRADAQQSSAIASESPGEYAGRPPSPAARLVVPLLGSSAAFAGLLLVLDILLFGPSWWQTWTGVALLAAASPLILIRLPVVRVLAGAGLFSAALMAPTTPMRALDAVGPPMVPYLAVGAAAATLALAGTAAAWAHALDVHRRRRALDAAAATQTPAPRGFLRREGSNVLDVASLRAFADHVHAVQAPGGLLVVQAPGDDPFWSVPDKAYEWLNAQPPAGRIHVAVVEPDGVHLLPPIWPEERDA